MPVESNKDKLYVKDYVKAGTPEQNYYSMCKLSTLHIVLIVQYILYYICN